MRNAFVAFVGSEGAEGKEAQINKCPLNRSPSWKEGGILPRASSRSSELETLCPDGCHPWMRGIGSPGLGVSMRAPPSEPRSWCPLGG